MSGRIAMHLLAAGALAGAVLLAGAAEAGSLVVSAVIGGAPTGANKENFDGLALGAQSSVLTPSGIIVTTSGNAQAVSGSQSGVYAAPVLSGGQGQGFGSPNQADGTDATRYLAAGTTGSGGKITLLLPGQELYLGLLWGSVDSYNTLTLMNGATTVGQVGGQQVIDLAHASAGSQSSDGTVYVNISSDISFDRVIIESSSYTFEFDDVAFAATVPRLAEPGSSALVALGALGAIALRRRRLRRA